MSTGRSLLRSVTLICFYHGKDSVFIIVKVLIISGHSPYPVLKTVLKGPAANPSSLRFFDWKQLIRMLQKDQMLHPGKNNLHLLFITRSIRSVFQ